MQVERNVTLTLTNFILKITVSVYIGGKLIAAGTLVEVSRMEALDLLHRHKAVAATEDDVATGAAIIASRTIDTDPDPNAWRVAAKWDR